MLKAIFFGWAGLSLLFIALALFQAEYLVAVALTVIAAYPIALVAYLRDRTVLDVGEADEPQTGRVTRRIWDGVRFTWFYLIVVLVISGFFQSAKLSLFFLAVGFAPYALAAMVRKSNKKAAAEAAIKGDFKPAYRAREAGGPNLLLLDPKSRRFAIRRGTKMRYYPYSDLIAVEVEKDGSTIQKTTNESSFIGAVAGGLIAGPVGMALGLFSGGGSTTTSREIVHELALKLHINDAEAPAYRLKFLQSRTGCSAKQAQSAAKTLDEWYARMRGVLQPQP